MPDEGGGAGVVVLVHYHLGGGGVSRVIAQTCGVLRERGVRHVVMCGNPVEAAGDLPVVVVPELGYGEDAWDAERVVDGMLRAVGRSCGSGVRVWHFHNPALGKNRVMAEVVRVMAESGERLLLQVHDLAEDGRPENQPALERVRCLYPVGSHVRYGFINRRDLGRFAAAGLPAGSGVYLPDPLGVPVAVTGRAAGDLPALVLAPCRGIRRKNLGEVLLWSALAPDGVEFATTLEPRSGLERDGFRRWRELAGDLGLPVRLGVVPDAGAAGDVVLAGWLGRATHHLTTSVAEGFGLTYLEPALLGRPVLGRNLPEITGDFAGLGVAAGDWYDAVRVPSGWFAGVDWRGRVEAACGVWFRAYGREPDPGFARVVVERKFSGGSVDFGDLPVDLQEQALRRVCAGGAGEVRVVAGGTDVPAAGWLAGVLARREGAAGGCPAALGPEAHAGRLLPVYQELWESVPGAIAYLDRGAVLDTCLVPDAFRFLRCGG